MQHLRAATTSAVFLAVLPLTRHAQAYDRYSVARDATNCRACHGDFRAASYISPRDGLDWGNLHDLHRNTMLNGDCDTCHSSGRFPVYTWQSTGGTGLAALSCTGCHGREADNGVSNPSSPHGYAAGLRQHHVQAGVTECLSCHADADAATYTAVGEDVLPPYYASPGTGHPNIPTDSCNPAGEEDFAGSPDGLDNDGDQVYDTADPDCGGSLCGNGAIDPGETCDPPATCPSNCDDGNGCTADTMSGTPATCDVSCTHAPIVGCVDGDGCCPASCSSATDSDCSASCGDGVIDPGETCDPPATCPSSCDDGDACTTDTLTGSAANCNVACTNTSIVSCVGGDGCCPAGCNANTDGDCPPLCGNGVVEPGETCDPPATCPSSCDDGDACTSDSLGGSAASCDAVCTNTLILTCAGGDGCCPAGCDANSDGDCPPLCGNAVVEPGETCDPPATCPSSCDDGDACTTDALGGSAASCDAACTHTLILACAGGDGCCPAGCDETSDTDCPPGTADAGLADATGDGAVPDARQPDGGPDLESDAGSDADLDAAGFADIRPDGGAVGKDGAGEERGAGDATADRGSAESGAAGCGCRVGTGPTSRGAVILMGLLCAGFVLAWRSRARRASGS
jgi:hypothetical protein